MADFDDAEFVLRQPLVFRGREPDVGCRMSDVGCGMWDVRCRNSTFL